MRGPIVIVHGLDDARAALAAAAELGVAVILRSAPGAAAYLGAATFREMVAEAARAHPGVAVTAVLDCADDPGLALNALREGVKAVRVAVAPAVEARIADIAAQVGAVLDDDDGPALDLLYADDPCAACRAWLDPSADHKPA